jgi:hypothetical protein
LHRRQATTVAAIVGVLASTGVLIWALWRTVRTAERTDAEPLVGNDRRSPFRAEISEDAAHAASNHREQCTFDQQLCDESCSTSTERRSNGNFLFSGGGTSEEQVSNIGARNEEQQHDSGKRVVKHALEAVLRASCCADSIWTEQEVRC